MVWELHMLLVERRHVCQEGNEDRISQGLAAVHREGDGS